MAQESVSAEGVVAELLEFIKELNLQLAVSRAREKELWREIQDYQNGEESKKDTK
jgi:hypothetical protein